MDEKLDDTLRSLDLTQIGEGRFKAVNRRGGVLPIGSGDDPDFTPVELLLAALAGCTAIDVGSITGKRSAPESFDIRTTGHKIRDDDGSHLVDLDVSISITFPEGEAGDRAREVLPRAVRQTADRICTVGRTLQLGTTIGYDVK
ncbi:OsmC family protein [Nocardioides cynanchi]|uniref:OsmC family protein n=1 Tax=Nocardioides cynanchi TaxID=2558918 RepID=UPI00124781A6|nr:OsmC family protein [Nocardioides cynanchi]